MVHLGKGIFLLILLTGIWQDVRCSCIERRYLEISFLPGLLCCIVAKREWTDVVAACGIGVLLLIISKLTSGEIGEGDGWFFIVSGMYINRTENLNLLLSGLVLSFLWSMGMMFRGIITGRQWRKQRMAFLPFLLPGGIWLVLGS